MGALVVLALDPGPQPAIEGVEALERRLGERREELHAHRAEPALLLALALWLIGPGVDEGDAELGADEREVVRAEGGAVVDVEPLGDAAAQDGLLEHGQEGGGVLGEREGGVGHDAGGVVEKRDEVGSCACACRRRDRGAVHDVAHPELVGLLEGEAAAVLAVGSLGRLSIRPWLRAAGAPSTGRGGAPRRSRLALAPARSPGAPRSAGVSSLISHSRSAPPVGSPGCWPWSQRGLGRRASKPPRGTSAASHEWSPRLRGNAESPGSRSPSAPSRAAALRAPARSASRCSRSAIRP